jgi:cell fate (sporulation/competence/biofilm development) regulator YlbF (YheA/YmcA/DUF963 family)
MQITVTDRGREKHMDEWKNQDSQQVQAESVEKAMAGLVHAVWESSEYRRYQDIRRKVHEQPELEQRIHAFRKKNYEVQNFADGRSLYEKVDGLEREGLELRKDPLVNEYLDAELGICRLFQKINWELVQNIDFDLGFVADP